MGVSVRVSGRVAEKEEECVRPGFGFGPCGIGNGKRANWQRAEEGEYGGRGGGLTMRFHLCFEIEGAASCC